MHEFHLKLSTQKVIKNFCITVKGLARTSTSHERCLANSFDFELIRLWEFPTSHIGEV